MPSPSQIYFWAILLDVCNYKTLFQHIKQIMKLIALKLSIQYGGGVADRRFYFSNFLGMKLLRRLVTSKV